MLNVIRNWVIRTMMKSKGETGIVKTIPKRDLVELNTQVTAQRLMENGIDPNSLKNTDQVENAIIAIENRPKIQEGIRSTTEAKVFDMEGKEIPKGSKIMGGKQAETEAETLARIEEENKKGIEGLKQKMKKEQARSKRISGNLRNDNQLRGQTEEIGKPKIDEDEYEYYREILDDEENMIVQGDETRKQLDAMVKEAEDEVAYMKRLYDKGALDPPEDFAQGGRAGFVAGGIANLAARLARGFMKVTGRKPNDEELMKIIREAAERDFAEVSDDVALKGVSETRATARRMDSIDKDELKKIIDEYKMPVRTQEQFDFAQGGRAGFSKGSGLKTLFDFLNKNNPAQAYSKYLKSVKDRMKAGKEAEVAGEVIPIAAGGALITNQLKKKLKAMNEEQKKEFKKDMEKKADGGRIGYADGTPSFEEYLKERGMIEKRQNLEKLMKEYQEDMRRKNVMEQKQMAADGGRIGLKAGMTKRAFLKLMGGTGAAIGAAKSGIFSGLSKGAGKQAAKEVVEQGVRSTPPPYFFELANKIKMLGKPDKVTYADRVEIHRYTGKNGDEYELIEDLSTGDVRITKDKTGVGSYGDKTFDTIEDRTVLEYKKGDADVDPESGTAFKSADEYEEYKVEFDADGTAADATELDAVVQKEIIEEATGDAPSIKKAGGGIARMLGE